MAEASTPPTTSRDGTFADDVPAALSIGANDESRPADVDDEDEWEYEYSSTETEVSYSIRTSH